VKLLSFRLIYICEFLGFCSNIIEVFHPRGCGITSPWMEDPSSHLFASELISAYVCVCVCVCVYMYFGKILVCISSLYL
jgi:hypothetical protein